MDIKIGDIVFVRHYSGQDPIKSIVRNKFDENLSLKLTSDFASFNFFEGDPVVAGFESKGNVFLTSCILSDISLKHRTINLKIGKIEQISDMRRNERFPVSLYANVRVKGSGLSSLSVVKNISFNGMMFCTKADYAIEQDLEFDINIDNKLLFMNASVIWKVNGQQNSEYGAEIKLKSQKTADQLKQYLQTISEEQQAFIKQLRELI